MQTKHMWNRVPATAALFIVGALGLTGVACGVNPSAHHDLDEVAETMALLDIPGLTFNGVCAFNPLNGNLLVTLATSDKVIIGRDSGNGNITVNGNSTTCQNANFANLKLLAVTVTGGGVATGESVVLDYANGSFGMSNGTALTGTQIDLGGTSGTLNDKFFIRTTDSNAISQNITVGSWGIYMSASNFNDILLAGNHNPNRIIFALGAGNDRINARGAVALGNNGATPPVPTPPGAALTIFTNAGADVIYTSGSNFNDIYSGGDGNDTIYVSPTVSTGHQVYDGNNGLDTVDFSSRVLATKLYNSASFISGDFAGNENCKIANAEILVGGSGPDILQGGASLVNMWLYGGPGNDNFIQGVAGAGDSNDVISGGPGIDTVDYSVRTIGVNVTLDGNPNDGSPSGTESDNIGTDVENITTGTGIDLLVGNGNSNVLDGGGGAGANIIQGLGGDDRFVQTSAGQDTIACGAGVDTIDYSPRSATIVATLDGVTPSGTTSEGDVLGADCENLNGAGQTNATVQTLVGNSGDNTISAGVSTGAVSIDCQGGQDIAIGDAGASNAPGAISNCEMILP